LSRPGLRPLPASAGCSRYHVSDLRPVLRLAAIIGELDVWRYALLYLGLQVRSLPPRAWLNSGLRRLATIVLPWRCSPCIRPAVQRRGAPTTLSRTLTALEGPHQIRLLSCNLDSREIIDPLVGAFARPSCLESIQARTRSVHSLLCTLRSSLWGDSLDQGNSWGRRRPPSACLRGAVNWISADFKANLRRTVGRQSGQS